MWSELSRNLAFPMSCEGDRVPERRTVVNADLLIPKRLQFETFYGCNARCVMCALSQPATRKVGMMPLAMSQYVMDEFAPYVDRVEKMDLFGIGEPLLDVCLYQRIAYAKKLGYRNIAISTNAEKLDRNQQEQLLGSGIDTVIVSIDGVRRETHEAIRKNTHFEQVVRNCENTIALRNSQQAATRFIIRYIRQESNVGEWDEFREYWCRRLSGDKRDLLIVYDMNTFGGTTRLTKRELIPGGRLEPSIERRPCQMVFDRLIVLNDGNVPLCCEDTPRAEYCLGNVKDSSPVAIFNSEKWHELRRLHADGRKNVLPICRDCTVLYSEKQQQVFDGHDLLA
ncbi:MAG: radical SAM protein [Pirellulaceae bacterium]